MSYLLGWSIIPQIQVRRERWPAGYTIVGQPLVQPGQFVQPDQPVLRVEKVQPASAMAALSLSPMPVATGASSKASPGMDEARITGQRGSEVLPAGMRGKVIELTRRGGVVIESQAALIQGTIGVGNQVAGVLSLWRAEAASHAQQVIPAAALLVIPGPLNFALLRQAMNSGVAGVIASSITMRDLEGFVHADLLQLVDSADIELAQMYLPPLTLLLTEGLGSIEMPAQTLHLLSKYQGSIALLSGTTALRQGIYPELLISLPESALQANWQAEQLGAAASIGVQVRICGGEHEGEVGVIDHLFTHQQVFSSGVSARAARLRLSDGSYSVVSLTALKCIG